MPRLLFAAFFIAGSLFSFTLVFITVALTRRRHRLAPPSLSPSPRTHPANEAVDLASTDFPPLPATPLSTAVTFARPAGSVLQSLFTTALMLIALTLAGLLIYVCMRLQLVSESASQIMQRALPGITQTAAYEALIREKCRLLLEHIIANDPIIMDGIQAKLQQVGESVSELETEERSRLAGDSDSALFDRCVQDRRNFDATFPPILAQSQLANNGDAMTLYYRNTRPAFNRLIDEIDTLRDHDQSRGSKDSIAIVDVATGAQFTTVVAGVLTILGGIALAIVLVRIVIPAIGILSYSFSGDRTEDLSSHTEKARPASPNRPSAAPLIPPPPA